MGVLLVAGVSDDVAVDAAAPSAGVPTTGVVTPFGKVLVTVTPGTPAVVPSTSDGPESLRVSSETLSTLAASSTVEWSRDINQTPGRWRAAPTAR